MELSKRAAHGCPMRGFVIIIMLTGFLSLTEFTLGHSDQAGPPWKGRVGRREGRRESDQRSLFQENN